MHGLLGFAEIGCSRLSIQYFRGLKQDLSDLPAQIYFPSLPAAGSIKARAEALARFIEGLDTNHICLIGHSMGGLDSRYYACYLDPGHRVKQIITIGTPHHGTPLASWVINRSNILHAVLNMLVHPAIADLTIEACTRFNEQVPDRADIYYESYAGSRPMDEVPPWFRPWSKRLLEVSGDNDCQVPVSSAHWGNFCGVLRADHTEQIGWNLGLPDKEIERPFNHRGFYRGVLEASLARFELQSI